MSGLDVYNFHDDEEKELDDTSFARFRNKRLQILAGSGNQKAQQLPCNNLWVSSSPDSQAQNWLAKHNSICRDDWQKVSAESKETNFDSDKKDASPIYLPAKRSILVVDTGVHRNGMETVLADLKLKKLKTETSSVCDTLNVFNDENYRNPMDRLSLAASDVQKALHSPTPFENYISTPELKSNWGNLLPYTSLHPLGSFQVAAKPEIKEEFSDPSHLRNPVGTMLEILPFSTGRALNCNQGISRSYLLGGGVDAKTEHFQHPAVLSPYIKPALNFPLQVSADTGTASNKPNVDKIRANCPDTNQCLVVGKAGTDWNSRQFANASRGERISCVTPLTGVTGAHSSSLLPIYHNQTFDENMTCEQQTVSGYKNATFRCNNWDVANQGMSNMTTTLKTPKFYTELDQGLIESCDSKFRSGHQISAGDATVDTSSQRWDSTITKEEFVDEEEVETSQTFTGSQPCDEDALLDRLKHNLLEEIPQCGCRDPYDESVEGPYYTHLGVGPNVAAIRTMMENRLNIRGTALRIEKILFTGKEGKSQQGCPIAKWVIRRSGPGEKALVLTRARIGHHCSHAVMIVGICLWDGIQQEFATELYDYVRHLVPTDGEMTERRCGWNEQKTCACQGWNDSTGGASFSFGCSWSMYYNACKFARSDAPRKFRLKSSSKEAVLEQYMQKLANIVAPIYERAAPDSFRNQVQFEAEGSSCRIGTVPGYRPWSGVTAVVDFCTHSHKDNNNMNNGCTTIVTLTKHRSYAEAKDEQLHVLPLCILDATDEHGNVETQLDKIRCGAIECLSRFPMKVRMHRTPVLCKSKRARLDAIARKQARGQFGASTRGRGRGSRGALSWGASAAVRQALETQWKAMTLSRGRKSRGIRAGRRGRADARVMQSSEGTTQLDGAFQWRTKNCSSMSSNTLHTPVTNTAGAQSQPMGSAPVTSLHSPNQFKNYTTLDFVVSSSARNAGLNTLSQSASMQQIIATSKVATVISAADYSTSYRKPDRVLPPLPHFSCLQLPAAPSRSVHQFCSPVENNRQVAMSVTTFPTATDVQSSVSDKHLAWANKSVRPSVNCSVYSYMPSRQSYHSELLCDQKFPYTDSRCGNSYDPKSTFPVVPEQFVQVDHSATRSNFDQMHPAVIASSYCVGSSTSQHSPPVAVSKYQRPIDSSFLFQQYQPVANKQPVEMNNAVIFNQLQEQSVAWPRDQHHSIEKWRTFDHSNRPNIESSLSAAVNVPVVSGWPLYLPLGSDNVHREFNGVAKDHSTGNQIKFDNLFNASNSTFQARSNASHCMSDALLYGVNSNISPLKPAASLKATANVLSSAIADLNDVLATPTVDATVGASNLGIQRPTSHNVLNERHGLELLSDAALAYNRARALTADVQFLQNPDVGQSLQFAHSSAVYPRSCPRTSASQNVAGGDCTASPSVKVDDQLSESYTDNVENFRDGRVGGVAIALTHGSVLFEVAKRELHATTALKNPNRAEPTRISLVFYQHKNLNFPNHGRCEFERRRQLRETEAAAAASKLTPDSPSQYDSNLPLISNQNKQLAEILWQKRSQNLDMMISANNNGLLENSQHIDYCPSADV